MIALFATRRRNPIARQAMRGLAVIAVMAFASGCRAGREEAGQAAMKLAEAIYPGQLELYDTHLQKGYYDVTLAVKDDPVTRIRFAMDRNPADCTLGTPCEERLRRAYDNGIALGQEIKALDTTFRNCGIPVLAVHWYGGTSGLVPIIEQRLTNENQHKVVDALAACVTTFRAAYRDTAWWDQRSAIRIIISSNDKGRKAQAPDPLNFEASVPGFLQSAPAYSVTFSLDRPDVEAGALRFLPFYPLNDELRKAIGKEAESFLRKQPDDVILETFVMLWETELDPERVDVIRTYVLACTHATRDGKRCRRGDVALRVQYDLENEQVTDIQRMPLARDHHGSAIFAPLPRRTDPPAP
ncbi:hypothetical protein NOF55_02840 [Rhizobiaceae bacterium BDR2-2]|uniref:Uncharacterized protein n=1 Tax=Ectorhizobium quercum TaxID=2965071 RepID=A0AAE3MZH6_9HYPH|nr:hypothetical protein [Ectorhizobium quercum]MCX8996032.1 hypothetical protein [Ectorhizobium quercum]